MDLTDKFNETPELLDDSIYNTKLYEILLNIKESILQRLMGPIPW
jgi:hypothetical protein